MLRSKWRSLLLNLVLLYLADVTDTRWPLERAVHTKCADTQQATGAWESASIIVLITVFSLSCLSCRFWQQRAHSDAHQIQTLKG